MRNKASSITTITTSYTTYTTTYTTILLLLNVYIPLSVVLDYQ